MRHLFIAMWNHSMHNRHLYGLLLGLACVSCQNETLLPEPAPKTPVIDPLVAQSRTIEESLRTLEPSVRQCFPSDARWVAVLSFIVEPSGKASSISFMDESAETPAAKCAVSLVEKVTFPVPLQGRVRVAYPLVLGPIIEPADVIPVPGSSPVTRPTSEPTTSPSSQPSAVEKGAAGVSSVADAKPLMNAEIALALGQLEEAEQALAPYQQNGQVPTEALYVLGVIAQKRGQVPQMCRYFKEYLEKSPTSPSAPGLRRQVKNCDSNTPKAP